METLGDDADDETLENARPFLMGKAAAVVNDEPSAKEIIDDMVGGAVKWLATTNGYVVRKSSL